TPNPATDFMQLTFESASKDAGQLLIYDNLGRLVSQQASQWTAGENQLEIQVQILGKGSYYLLLQGQQGHMLTKSFQVH
ncbi:MAG: T9SS type A sorting domain-containing protein, partial [Bacteroidota bacterium]